ncbi:MAG: SDR family NAD(P)-dependent oxidoreductase [Nocardioidaceae bacterium]|nr:SDR family NAD(P)-dependent oxidoreductase [Nocardioidaceae bacterium]
MRIVVTGAGPDSIGLATAVALRDLGHEVVVTTRSVPVDGFAWHPLDLASRTSVAAFASWFGATYDGLDALVNNAGIHLDLRSTWKQPQLVDGHEIHWRTNYLGTADLTRALLPLLLSAPDPRVVHVVSKLHERGRNEAFFSAFGDGYDSWVAYGTSKLALVHDAASLAVRHPGLRAYSLHPGSVYTHIADRGLETAPLLGRLRALAAPLERRMLATPAQGAETSVHCVTAPDATSGYYRRSAPAEPAPQAGDEAARAALWARTSDWLVEEAR